VAAVRELAAASRTEVLIGVDGGVTIGNAAEIAGWEPDIIVSGSAIFDRRNPSRNLELLVQALDRPVRVP
jgi:pentose-5-phosphate-3-epimerase